MVTTRRPISLTSAQMRAINGFAIQIPEWRRHAYMQMIADELEGRPEIGDGDVHRAATSALRRVLHGTQR